MPPFGFRTAFEPERNEPNVRFRFRFIKPGELNSKFGLTFRLGNFLMNAFKLGSNAERESGHLRIDYEIF